MIGLLKMSATSAAKPTRNTPSAFIATFCEISRVIRTRARGEMCSVGQCEAKNKSQDYQPSRTSGSTVSSGDSPAGRISRRTVWQRLLVGALRVLACRCALDVESRLSLHSYAAVSKGSDAYAPK